MATELKTARRAAKRALSKAIGQLEDVVLENFSARDIQERINDVKDALETSIDKNDEYIDQCREESVESDGESKQWCTEEKIRVNHVVKEAIDLMRQLKINAVAEEKTVLEAEAKIAGDRLTKSKREAYKRNVASLRDSVAHLDGLLQGNESC